VEKNNDMTHFQKTVWHVPGGADDEGGSLSIPRSSVGQSLTVWDRSDNEAALRCQSRAHMAFHMKKGCLMFRGYEWSPHYAVYSNAGSAKQSPSVPPDDGKTGKEWSGAADLGRRGSCDLCTGSTREVELLCTRHRAYTRE